MPSRAVHPRIVGINDGPLSAGIWPGGYEIRIGDPTSSTPTPAGQASRPQLRASRPAWRQSPGGPLWSPTGSVARNRWSARASRVGNGHAGAVSQRSDEFGDAERVVRRAVTSPLVAGLRSACLITPVGRRSSESARWPRPACGLWGAPSPARVCREGVPGKPGYRQIMGQILAKGHPVFDAYVGKPSPVSGVRNPVSYIDADEDLRRCECGCGAPARSAPSLPPRRLEPGQVRVARRPGTLNLRRRPDQDRASGQLGRRT